MERYRSTGDSTVFEAVHRGVPLPESTLRDLYQGYAETRLTVIRVQKSSLMMSRLITMRRFNRTNLFETGRTEFAALSLEAGEVERPIEL